MKSKKVLTMLFSFLISIIVFCTCVVIAVSVIRCDKFTLAAILEQISSTFLYITGYDSLYIDNWIVKCALAIVGILALSFLSAYLTVLFLYRTDVKICPKIFIWQNMKGYYYCTVIIKNLGKTVCNLQISLGLYSSTEKMTDNENIIAGETCERFRPILLAKQSWQESFIVSPVESILFFKTFQCFVNKEKYNKLYVLWSFVDEMTGQETIHVQSYDYQDCIFDFPNWKYKKCKKYNKCKKFKRCKKCKEMAFIGAQNQFEEFIRVERHVIPLKNAIPINAAAIRLSYIHLPNTQRDAMTMEIDYSQVNLNAIGSEFLVMASIQFKTPENWELFFDKKWEFQFEMFGDTDRIETVTVEIKKKERLEKVLWREFKVQEKLAPNGPGTRYSIPLCSDKLIREDFQEIKEVDFTVFLKHMKNKEHLSGSVTIVDCVLAKHIEVELEASRQENVLAMAEE